MAEWLSSEQRLVRAIAQHLYSSPLMKEVNDQIYDKPQIDFLGDTYIVIGETNVMDRKLSTSMTEWISVTFHVYHKNEEYPELTVDETRQFVKWLRYYAEQINIMPIEHYEIQSVRLDTQNVITDVDFVTQHGVLRLKYKVRHKTRY